MTDSIAAGGGDQTLGASRGKGSSWRTSRRAALLIVLVAAVIRLTAFPHRYELRDIDEVGYLNGGLTLIEGITPGYKAAPGGVEHWIGWTYAVSLSIEHLIHPGAEEKGVPISARPLVAVNHALFDTYRDFSLLHWIMIGLFNVLTIYTAWAAARLGYNLGGLPGAMMTGGMFALLPLFVAYTEMSRPYILAWDFSTLALAASAAKGNQSIRPGVLLGLAIACRVETLCVMPLVAWMLWNNLENPNFRRAIFRAMATAIIVALLISPWLILNLFGNLRAIVTIRFTQLPSGRTPWLASLQDMLWGQGLGPMCLVILGAIFLLPPKERFRYLILFVYVSLLVASFLHERGFGIHQHAPFLIGFLLLAGLAARTLKNRSGATIAMVIGAVLILPAIQTSRLLAKFRREYVYDGSTQWIQSHVPSGTPVYEELWSWTLTTPLPTSESADTIWNEVANTNVWKAKLELGLQRFGLSATDAPRAFSEENMIQERGNRRGYFILGSRTQIADPRYDLHLIGGSPAYGLQAPDVKSLWLRTGGVVVWRTLDGAPLPNDLGQPTVSWISPGGAGVYVFYKPKSDVLAGPN